MIKSRRTIEQTFNSELCKLKWTLFLEIRRNLHLFLYEFHGRGREKERERLFNKRGRTLIRVIVPGHFAGILKPAGSDFWSVHRDGVFIVTSEYRENRRKVKEPELRERMRERERERERGRSLLHGGVSLAQWNSSRGSWRSNFETVFAGAVKFKQAAGLFYCWGY